MVHHSKNELCYIVIALLLLSLVTSASSGRYSNYRSKCRAHQIDSPIGCIKSCRSPDFNDCPDFFPLIFDPHFCGFTEEGNWVDFTFACQACQDSNVIGIVQEPCSCQFLGCPKGQICQGNQCVDKIVDKCENVKCKDYQFCQDGRCLNKCALVKCSAGHHCVNGQCIPDQPQCSIAKKIQCTNPRPNDKTCPIVDFIRAPDPLVCGVDKNGNKVDYPVQCYACKQKQNAFYYNVPCAKVTQNHCGKNQECVDGKCVQIDKCANVRCYFFQFCQNGKCLNKCSLVKCSAGFHCVNGECIINQPICSAANKIQCKNPRANKDSCPVAVYIRAPDPAFCGIDKDGNQVDYDQQCQACAEKDNVFYFNAPCAQVNQNHCNQNEECVNGQCVLIDKCANIQCKDYQFCQDGECLNLCVLSKCALGYHCVNGNCIPDQPQCSTVNKIQCANPRPNQKTCPNVVYIRAPDPKVCGVDSYGNQIDYPRDCEACKNKNNVFYFDVPCAQVNQNGCSTNEDCVNGKCVQIDKCAAIRCRSGFHCQNGDCIADVKPCNKLCIQGYHCENGQCVPDNKCANVKCQNYQFCLDGQCTDNCARIRCLTGACRKGECVPIDNCAAVTCLTGSQCIDGQCVPIDKCVTVKCSAKAHCENGQCVPDVKPCNKLCIQGTHCQNGYCVPDDKCANIRCKQDYKCQNGDCVPIDQCFGRCKNWQGCFNGKCQDPCILKKCPNCFRGRCGVPFCQKKSDCSNSQHCIDNFCYDPCSDVTCQQGKHCRNGYCTSIDQCYGLCKSWQRCFNGKCQDRCLFLRCANCFRGRCGVPSCQHSSDCSSNSEYCIDGFCYDPCQGVICRQGQQCYKGQCSGHYYSDYSSSSKTKKTWKVDW